MKASLSAYRPHDRVQNDPGGDSRTKQAFQQETDINNIMRQHEKGLLVDHLNAHRGDYGDFIDAPDYHTALNRIHEADKAFMTIPAHIRAEFNNDPAEFLDFAQNPDNLDDMREMGLAPPERPGADKATQDLDEPDQDAPTITKTRSSVPMKDGEDPPRSKITTEDPKD